MAVINGAQYLRRLNSLGNEIWFDGEKVTGQLSKFWAFKGLLETKASLYDLQVSPKLIDEMTYISPSSQELVSLSYLQPKSLEDLRKRRKMIEHWARHTNGILGRSPDYLNSVLMSFASSTYLLNGKDHCYPGHLLTYYELAREQDLSLTHTFISPQVNRSPFYVEKPDLEEPIAAKIIGETKAGLIVKGARLLATQGGLTDEVLVLSGNRNLFSKGEAFAFAIPSNTKGLRFICRDTFIGGDSKFDHPLSSRYEEMDSVVVFDEVVVPWERVFYYNNEEVATSFPVKSAFHNFAMHQAITRQTIKLEFMLGIAELLVDTLNIRAYQHVQEKIAEMIAGLETMRALLERSEHYAKPNVAGYLCPDIFALKAAGFIYQRTYPRFVEIIQLIGASGMITLPSERAFFSEIQVDLNRYLQGANTSAKERVAIFRLAWDLTMSAFGTRQTQYERYFFGDPIRLASDLYETYPKESYIKAVQKIIKKDGL